MCEFQRIQNVVKIVLDQFLQACNILKVVFYIYRTIITRLNVDFCECSGVVFKTLQILCNLQIERLSLASLLSLL
jgi:hypothetical protein